MSRRNRLPTPNQPQANVQIDLSDAVNVVCNKCQNVAFQAVAMFKHISAIVSPTGEAGIVPIQTYMCTACGFINDEFLPSPVKLPEDEDEQQSSIISTDLSR
jgi:hypothetical protein